MAITIDWATYTINIPRADMLLLQTTPIEVRQLDLTTFHEVLRSIEDDPEGMPQPVTHNYSGSTSISGVILAQVVEILDPYTITFEDGQYAVNVVGGNSNVADKVNINNVGVRTANSAGLQDLTSLQAASYSNGSVAIDVNSQYSGTIFPIGTRGYPVNNIADAHQIAEERGLNQFAIMRSFTLSNETLTDGYVFLGDNPALVTITIDPSAEVSNCVFKNVSIQGTLDNFNILDECVVYDVTHINGIIRRCSLEGSVTLDGVGEASLLECTSGVAGTSNHPEIIWGAGSITNLLVRGYNGGLGLQNCTQAGVVSSLDFNAGSLHVDVSMVAGTHGIRGICSVTIDQGVTATINDTTTTKQITNAPIAIWDQPAALHDSEGTFGHYVNYLKFVEKRVYLDTQALTNGNGSQDHPFNNILDAVDKAEQDGISTLVLAGDVILHKNLKNITIHGIGLPEFDANGFDLKGVKLYQVKFKGAYTSPVIAQECNLLNGAYLDGYFENCGLGGDLICNTTTAVLMKDCASLIAGTSRPTISMNSGGWTELSIRGYSGGLTIKDCDNALDRVTVELLAGSLTYDATNTAGIMVARGTGKFIDQTTGATVVDETISAPHIATHVWEYTQ